MQIQLTSEITSTYSTTSVIIDLFYTLYTYNRHLRYLDKEINILNDKKYIKNYAHVYFRKTKQTRSFNNYCGIWADISRNAYWEILLQEYEV